MKHDFFDLACDGDGYRVEQVCLCDYVLALHVGVYQRGVLTNFVTEAGACRDGADAAPELFSWRHPTFAEQGECDRLFHLLEAIARYLNTGGTWEQFDLAAGKMRGFAFGPLSIPGYTFRMSYLNDENGWEHIFLADDADARYAAGKPEMVVWPEEYQPYRCTIEEFRKTYYGPALFDYPKEGGNERAR